MKIKPGDEVQLAPPMGNFNLPILPKKVLFIAIGIGATPFRSMVAELNNKDQLDKWDIKMIQISAKGPALFDSVFSKLGDNRQVVGPRPRLTPEVITGLMPDAQQRLIYLAGPEGMTSKLHDQLAKSMPLNQLRLSYFPGYKSADS